MYFRCKANEMLASDVTSLAEKCHFMNIFEDL